MLSAPGLRFHRALAPFLQLVVGSAHPAVGGGVRVHLFFIVVFLSSCVDFYFYYFCCIERAPAYLRSPG